MLFFMIKVVTISLNLLPKFDRQSLSTYLSSTCKTLHNHKFLDILSGLISQKIALLILEELHVKKDELCTNIDTKTIKKISNMILDWRFSVNGTHGFKHAEVSGGGVDTDSINPHTMESKKSSKSIFCR
jgi:predicted flavoprotein YhiN